MFNTFEKMFFFLPYLNNIVKFWQFAEVPIEMIYIYMMGGIIWLFFKLVRVSVLR